MMEAIDLNNYEAFLLDYLEGSLSEAMRAEMELFVITHPELEIDLGEADLPTFKAEQLEADFKMHLKKTELNFPDEQLLNYIDNNLPPAEMAAFDAKLLDDKELSADLALYKKNAAPS